MSSASYTGRLFLILGAPNAGKDVQAGRLAKRLGAENISTGDLLRKENDPRLMEIMSRGGLVPEEDFRRILSSAIVNIPLNKPIVLAGIAKKPGEAEWILEQLPKLKRELQPVIVLTIPKDISRERSLLRGRLDDDPGVQDERWARFYEETMRSIEIFREAGEVIEVDGVGTPDEVEVSIAKALGL